MEQDTAAVNQCANEGIETAVVQSGEGVCTLCNEMVKVVNHVVHHTGGTDQCE